MKTEIPILKSEMPDGFKLFLLRKILKELRNDNTPDTLRTVCNQICSIFGYETKLYFKTELAYVVIRKNFPEIFVHSFNKTKNHLPPSLRGWFPSNTDRRLCVLKQIQKIQSKYTNQ